MNSDDEVLEHAVLRANGGEEALPVTQEANLHELSNKQLVDQALEQLEHSTRHNCCHSLREDNVSAMLVAAFTNRNFLRNRTLTFLQ